ncbi:SEC14-like protein 2 [Pollicipes pollicipes]|uniref:SEC14-like protein 2 n=1 Tax=Pollicipes pollicipes TaxID=41117 RepID=UPI001884AC66|nr:SEC14-like protein 2 [Pollicipes pollicipes]
MITSRQWLVARDYDPGAAEDMFRKSMEWRRRHRVNDTRDWAAPEVIRRFFPHGSCGVDRGGHRVYIFNMGGLDMRGLMQCASRVDLVQFGLQVLETFKADCAEQSCRLGRFVGRSGVIVDLQGLQLNQITNRPGLDVILQWIQTMEANYPDTLQWCYVINAPTIFSIAWALISPLLHEVTRSKVRLFGTAGWQDELLKLMEPDQLPVFWGGSLVDADGDARCPSRICFAVSVPRELLTTREQLVALEKQLPHHVQVKAGSRARHPVQVEASGCRLRYIFITRDVDIDYSVQRCGDGADETLRPTQKAFSHLHPEQGSLVCSHPGTYYLEFDNTMSYFKKKDIFLRVTI